MTKTAMNAKEKSAKMTGKRNEPKHPRTAYSFWLSSKRDTFKTSGMKSKKVTKAAGRAWKELADKSQWEKMAAEDKARYERETNMQ